MNDQASPPTAPLSSGLNFKLSAMMFLQYAIWGAWLPLLLPFLGGVRGFDNGEIAWIFAVGAMGAIVAPFIAGQVADRWFNTEKYLGLSHIIGGVLVWQLFYLEGFWPFLAFSLVYSLVYSPTLSLTNSLAFHHLPDRDRDFGKVRLWGTLGWIVVGIGIGQWLAYAHTPAEGTKEAILHAQQVGMADAFKLSAILGILMGVYCFIGLPKTPPSKGKEHNAAFEALGEIRTNPLLTLFLLAVPVSCIHQFYFVYTAKFLGQHQVGDIAETINSIFGVGGGGLMTLGQMSEVAVLALIPLVAGKVSRKHLLATGLIAYAARMALFAYLPFGVTTSLLLGVAMHGFCFGCFIFVAFMIVDEECSIDVKASAQSLFNLVIVGIGVIVGSHIAGEIGTWATVGEVTDYTKLFSVPMYAALACLFILLIAYPRKSRRAGTPASD